MTVIEHAMAHAPLRPSYPGSPGRYGGRRHWRHHRRHPYHRGGQSFYVVEERPTYAVQRSPWYYPTRWNYPTWYPPRWYSSWFYEGFQTERNMGCGILAVLCLLILIGYFSKKK